MNVWNLSGEVLKWGVKGGAQYPKLWIHIQCPSPKNSTITDNKIFLNFDLDPNNTTKRGRSSEFIKARLEKGDRFIFVPEAMITMISSSKKGADGQWTKEELIGAKSKVENIVLSTDRFDDINIGFVRGPVQKYYYDQENDLQKFIIEEKYRNPSTNEWKSRIIPILVKLPSSKDDLTGKFVFVQASMCGVMPNGENKTYGWANKLIVT
jgi:hypothetical protein